jgi:hypothetical protein
MCQKYPECIANLKLPIDAFYRESRSGVNIAKRNITTGLFGLGRIQDFKLGGRILKNCAEIFGVFRVKNHHFKSTHVFDLTNLKGEKRRNVRKLNNELNIVY